MSQPADDLPFQVRAYNLDNLVDLLTEGSERCDRTLVESKAHTKYLFGYLGRLGSKTIVQERRYVDRDFLEDFAGYYVRCFHRYERKCSRLHFFRAHFTDADLKHMLGGDGGQIRVRTLKNSYLGFVVVRPLPSTIIGRTCLRTYSSDRQRRRFPTTRLYRCGLFGIPLEVTSLAFQEQDNVVAACATSALWSAFQGTGIIWHHPMPSPVEITRMATVRVPPETRNFPNKEGLTIPQMGDAIRAVGLDPLLLGAKEQFLLKATVRAYSEAQIPMVLHVALFDVSKRYAVRVGFHTVTVTGYSLRPGIPASDGGTGLYLHASRIDKLYVHDDQVGPFARMTFDGRPIRIRDGGKVMSVPSMSTSFGRLCRPPMKIRAVPFNVMVPVYHKVRISFEVVHFTVAIFDQFLQRFVTRKSPAEWDIQLTTVNKLKESIGSVGNMTANDCLEVRLEQMPRFIWRATASLGGSPILDLLFDATDIEQGRFFLRAIEHDRKVSAMLSLFARMPAVKEDYRWLPVWKVLEWFAERRLPEQLESLL